MKSPKVMVGFRLPQEVIDRIAKDSNSRDIPQTEIVEEALREKFERIDSGEDQGWGPLAQLGKEDRARTIKFINCMRAAPKDRGFRRAVDANFAWLMGTITKK